MEVEHFSHPHPLIFNEDQEYKSTKGVLCCGCEGPISGPCYRCISCDFYLHKTCADLPLEIKRHLHPEHPLLLLAKPPPEYEVIGGIASCDLCDASCNGFFYHCSSCQFDLDIKCAVPRCIFGAENQGHQFRRLLKSAPLKSSYFTCNFCGIDGDESPYFCTLCQLMFHKDCISKPHAMNIRQHPHVMTHTYFPREDESGRPRCGVCQGHLELGYGCYDCEYCSFVAHVSCAEEYVNNMPGIKATSNKSMSLTTNTARKVKCFSHEHDLVLIDEVKNNENCAACMLSISAPFYGCSLCNFFLHGACIGLPEQVQLQCWPYVGTLSSRANTSDGVFYCFLCTRYCHGFIYNTDIFGFDFDVRCGKIFSSGTITHESHEHPLFLSEKEEGDLNGRSCHACGNDGFQYLFRCAICDFNLDAKCATLPLSARHRYDEHPIILTYIDPNTYQFVCQICEGERDRKLWFYRCDECDFDAHPVCALGKTPFVKHGGTHTYDLHPHPLALVDKTEDYRPPLCHVCHKPCDDLALECTRSQCDFIIHRTGVCRIFSHV